MQHQRVILGPPDVKTTTPMERWNGAQPSRASCARGTDCNKQRGTNRGLLGWYCLQSEKSALRRNNVSGGRDWRATFSETSLRAPQSYDAEYVPRKPAHRNRHIQRVHPWSELSKRQKESINSPANSCQRFCVTHAPEIYQSPGLGVVSESLAAVQASDVGFSAIGRWASGSSRRNCLAQC